MKHKHAELMMQYAQDAMETDKPWEKWECNTGGVLGWVDMLHHPAWITETSYRHRPKMLSVTLMNGEVVSWPAPHRAELEFCDEYFYVGVDGSVIVEEWDCTAWDKDVLSSGRIHLTKEAAEQHAAALHKINNQVAK